APASLSFNTPMICSSVKRFRFMGLPPSFIQRWKIPVRNGPDIGEKVSGTGDDVLYGERDADTVYGGDGEDQLFAGSGSDTVYGGSGNDTITGEANLDTIFGGAGDDVLEGGAQTDTLFGGSGNDTLIGGDGNDTLTGGSGADVFRISASGGTDSITDFDTSDSGQTVSQGSTDYTLFTDQVDTSALSDVGNALTNQDGTVTADEITVTGGGGSDQLLTFPSGETVSVPDGTIDTTTTAAQFASLVSMGVPACFTPGTMILCEQGEKPVEDLWPGDRVVTADRGLQTLRWIGRRAIDFKDPNNRRSEKDKPVELKAGSLAPGIPRRNLVISAQHRMLLSGLLLRSAFGEDEALVLAKSLTERAHIRTMKGRRRVIYYSLLLDRHEIIFAEGAPTESYRPGPIALADFLPEHREQIFAIYPRLREEPIEGLGPPARMILTHSQARQFLSRNKCGIVDPESLAPDTYTHLSPVLDTRVSRPSSADTVSRMGTVIRLQFKKSIH
ncbi:MAG: Hint domain-containing protein, partial [Pseudomonadota bacterium]